MADATVGLLRAILSLDTATFEAGSRKAASAATALQKNIAGLGSQVERLTPQAERMVKALSGEKLLASANNLTAAVQKVGGASALTATQQARVNAQVTEAIAKYTALGQRAPAAMVALANATRQAERPTATLNTGISALTNTIARYVSVAALGGAVLRTLDYAGALEKATVALGGTTTGTQRLENIAAQTQTTLEAMTGAIVMMQDRLASGDPSAVAALKRLGLTVEQVFALNPDQQFMLIAKALQEIHTAEEQIQLGKDIFGRGAVEIVGALRSEVDQLADSLRTLSPVQIKQLSDAENAWNSVKLAAQRYFSLVTLFVAGPFTDEPFFRSVGPFARPVAPDLPRAKPLTPMGGLQTLGPTAADIRAVEEANRVIEQGFRRISDLARSLSGADAFQTARDYASAIVSIGGVTKLTTEEKARYAAVLEDVIEKYRVLGPAHAGQVTKYEAILAAIRPLIPTIESYVEGMTSLPPVIDAAAVSANAFNLIAEHGVDALLAYASAAAAAHDKLGKLGMLSPPGILSEDATGESGRITAEQRRQRLEEEADRMAEYWRQQAESIEFAITDSFARMLTGLDSFKDGFIGMWRSIRESVSNILSQMLQDFIGGYLRRAVAAAAGSALAGAGVGAAAGGGGAALAGAGGAGGAGGFLANPALWSNPWTAVAIGGAILGTLAWKKGWGRGGEEAADVNPRRDSFFGQLQARFGGSQFQAAAKAMSSANVPGSVAQRLIGSLYSADTLERWGVSQAAALAHLTIGGVRGLKSFAMGGFVPPGVVQPAILHGGRFGEDIQPRTSASGREVHQHNTINIYSQQIDTDGTNRFFERQMIPRLQMELRTNQHDLLTVLNQVKP